MSLEDRTDRPTVTFCFCWQFHFWELTVYVEQKNFARKILQASYVEFMKKSERNDWRKIDQRILLWMISKAIDNHMEEIFKVFLPDTQKLEQKIKKLIGPV